MDQANVAKKQLPEKKNIYVNGRGQIVDMLKILPLKERSKLLALIKTRNPTLANDLAEDSLGFDNLADLKDDSWKILMSAIHSQVLGVALKGVDRNFQRRILSLAPDRAYAESAYNAMMLRLPQERQDIERAQSRVVQSLNRMLKDRKITLI